MSKREREETSFIYVFFFSRKKKTIYLLSVFPVHLITVRASLSESPQHPLRIGPVKKAINLGSADISCSFFGGEWRWTKKIFFSSFTLRNTLTHNGQKQFLKKIFRLNVEITLREFQRGTKLS